MSQTDIMNSMSKISEASITIMATIVMAAILKSSRFFYWAAARLASLAKGSSYGSLLVRSTFMLFNDTII